MAGQEGKKSWNLRTKKNPDLADGRMQEEFLPFFNRVKTFGIQGRYFSSLIHSLCFIEPIQDPKMLHHIRQIFFRNCTQ